MVMARRTQEVTIEGERYQVQELSAREAFHVWDRLTAAEESGDRLGLYLDLVSLCLRHPNGERVVDEGCVDDLAEWPNRIIVPLAEMILEMSEVGMSPGKLQSVPESGSDTASRWPPVVQTRSRT